MAENNSEEKTVHFESGIPILGPPPEDENAQKRRDRKAQRTYEDRQLSLQHRIWWTQVGLVVFGLVGVAINGWQARTSQQSADTSENAILLAQKSERDAREANAEQGRQAAANLQKTLDKMQAQVEAMDASRRSADKNSAAAIQATIDSFHRQDRAWVGVSQQHPLKYETDPKTGTANLIVAFTLRNYGHSSADHIRFLAELHPELGSNPDTTCKAAEKTGLQGALLPTEELTVNWSMNLTRDEINKALSRQNPQIGRVLILIITGCIEYTDRDNEDNRHRTPFSYIVGTKKNYITPETRMMSGDELELHTFGLNTDQTR